MSRDDLSALTCLVLFAILSQPLHVLCSVDTTDNSAALAIDSVNVHRHASMRGCASRETMEGSDTILICEQ